MTQMLSRMWRRLEPLRAAVAAIIIAVVMSSPLAKRATPAKKETKGTKEIVARRGCAVREARKATGGIRESRA